jgi:Entner-Doudoroff aldolase
MESINDEFFTEIFAAQPFMAILRGFGMQRTVELALTAWNHGIRCVEVPIQSEEALDTLNTVAASNSTRGWHVGAGTVTTTKRVRQAKDAGAAFTVAPGFDLDVAQTSHNAGLPHLPGVATASEIQAAYRFGSSWLKAFPASVLGPGWFKAMHGPFPEACFVATGGMNADNAAQYLAAGESVIAVGSALDDPTQLRTLSVNVGDGT